MNTEQEYQQIEMIATEPENDHPRTFKITIRQKDYYIPFMVVYILILFLVSAVVVFIIVKDHNREQIYHLNVTNFAGSGSDINVEDYTYHIQYLHEGTCLGTDNNKTIIMSDCDKAPLSRIFHVGKGLYQIKMNDKCFTSDSKKIKLTECNNKIQKQLFIMEYILTIQKLSDPDDVCVTIEENCTLGDCISLHDCDQSLHQNFWLTY